MKQVSSWIWGGIKSSLSIVLKGLCYQVGKLSQVNIRSVPWIPSMEGFRVPPGLPIPPHISTASDIMNEDGLSWNEVIIRKMFPVHVADHILKTPITNMELDRAIWCPSTS